MTTLGILLAYGTSDGADKAWDARGRGRNSKDSDKQARAKAAYVPITKEKVATAFQREQAVASIIKGKLTHPNSPFDIIKGKIGIEVKTMFPGRKNDKITMHPASLERKMNFIKKNKLSAAYTVIIDDHTNSVYVAKGLGSFRLNSSKVTEVNSLQSLRNHIK